MVGVSSQRNQLAAEYRLLHGPAGGWWAGALADYPSAPGAAERHDGGSVARQHHRPDVGNALAQAHSLERHLATAFAAVDQRTSVVGQ